MKSRDQARSCSPDSSLKMDDREEMRGASAPGWALQRSHFAPCGNARDMAALTALLLHSPYENLGTTSEKRCQSCQMVSKPGLKKKKSRRRIWSWCHIPEDEDDSEDSPNNRVQPSVNSPLEIEEGEEADWEACVLQKVGYGNRNS